MNGYPAASALLGLGKGDEPRESIRGPFGRSESYARLENDFHIGHERLVMERDFDRDKVIEERGRVQWVDQTGPHWLQGNVSARFAGVADTSLVYEYQNCLKLDLRLGIDDECMRRGVRTLLDYLGRHHFLATFTYGGFVLLEDKKQVVGCAWCYRSFDPVRVGWTVWVRHLFIPRPKRRLHICRHFYDAAVSFFAEAGFPTKVRTVAIPKSDWHRKLDAEGFHPTPNEDIYFGK